METNVFESLKTNPEIYESKIFIISNKGLMNLRSKDGISEKRLVFKQVNFKDLLQKNKGAEKIEQYFQECRIGYINADGKRLINNKILTEVNKLLKDQKVEHLTRSESSTANNEKDDVSVEDEEEFKAMNDAEYKQFETLVSSMVATAVEMKKAKKTETDSTQADRKGSPKSSEDTKDNFVRKAERKFDETASKILNKFSEDAKVEQQRKEEAFKKDQLKDDQLRQDIKTEGIKKWDRLVDTIKHDLLDAIGQ
ncbi:MAG: hypothetical protein WC222_11130 [Parachlamydiales bacterium]|jgi:hypothetical protein